MAERVAAALAPDLGGLEAHRVVREAAQAEDFRAAVAALLDEEAAEELLDPAGYLGAAGDFVDRALATYDREA
jgi:3-carboxy-cis,cis-muconate cycloisomerase